MAQSVVDNDILLKSACYGIILDFLPTCLGGIGAIGILATALFVVPKSIRKRVLNGSREAALKHFDDFVQRVAVLEPTDEELETAARLERAAQDAGVALDAGESQLCAMTIHRELNVMATGDKRAIVALETLLDRLPQLNTICGKLFALEQLVSNFLLAGMPPGDLRLSICAEPQMDRALTICFACHSSSPSHEMFREALESYISDLKKHAKRILGH